jgi:glucokinase
MGFAIGVDVGGTKVLGGVVDDSGKVLKSARRDTPREGGAALTQTIADVAKELMQDFTVDSVGVSAAGFVSSDRKTMLATPCGTERRAEARLRQWYLILMLQVRMVLELT